MSDVINVSVTIKKAIVVSVTIANTVVGTAGGDVTVENSDATKSITVTAGDTLVIPSATFKLSDIVDGDYNLLPAGNGTTQAQRDKFQRIIPNKTGQTTSFVVADDGDLERGRGVAFLTLNTNNEFGNTNRFTDTAGNQNYDGTAGSLTEYIIDHLTTLAWYRVVQGTRAFNNAVLDGNAFAIHFTDWHLPNRNEKASILNDSIDGGLDYAPFNIALTDSNRLWTSTTAPGVTSRAFVLIQDNVNANGAIGHSPKNLSFNQIFCRNHYT